MALTRPAAIAAGAAALVLTAAGVTVAATGSAPADLTTTSTTTSTVAIDSTVAAELAFARDEERMARDLYAAIAEHYDGALPFASITNSEQRHFDAVGTLLDRYGLDDPADGRDPGDFANADIQALYDGWYDRAMTSLDEAYQVGIELEQRDIADLEDILADLDTRDGYADVERVFTALLNGSQHHLAAFEAAADGQTMGAGMGGMYGNGPRWGDQDDDSDTTRGNGYGNGRGMNGQGYGMGQGNQQGRMGGQGMGGQGYGPGDGSGDCPMDS